MRRTKLVFNCRPLYAKVHPNLLAANRNTKTTSYYAMSPIYCFVWIGCYPSMLLLLAKGDRGIKKAFCLIVQMLSLFHSCLPNVSRIIIDTRIFQNPNWSWMTETDSDWYTHLIYFSRILFKKVSRYNNISVSTPVYIWVYLDCWADRELMTLFWSNYIRGGEIELCIMGLHHRNTKHTKRLFTD